jgi:hypothetical protein
MEHPMKTIARRSRIGAALIAAAIAASCVDSQPAGLQVRDASPRLGTLTALSVNITPAGPLPTNTYCIFTAHVSGGTSPYHYQWKLNNSNVGADQNSFGYLTGTSPFRIQVFVTDAAMGAANDSKIITVSSSGFTC